MERLHHANIIAGEENSRDFIFDILANDLNFNIKANPDFLLMENLSFGIDDARDLKKWASGKPLVGEIKVSVIIAKSITHEAQNALLKVLEEPPAGTYIFINLENLGGLLPTLISRVRIIEIPKCSVEKDVPQSKADKFFHSKIKDKFSMVRSLSKSENKTDMKELIRDLEKISYENCRENMPNDISKSKMMKNILTAKVFASARGSSPKMLLEWLSCVL